MATSNGEMEKKKAIVDRIQQILDDAKNIDTITMNVSATRGEAAIIHYSVQEIIIPEQDPFEMEIYPTPDPEKIKESLISGNSDVEAYNQAIEDAIRSRIEMDRNSHLRRFGMKSRKS